MSTCGVMLGGYTMGDGGPSLSFLIWIIRLIVTPVLKIQSSGKNKHHLLRLIPCPSLSYLKPPFPLEDHYLHFLGGKTEAGIHPSPSSVIMTHSKLFLSLSFPICVRGITIASTSWGAVCGQ